MTHYSLVKSIAIQMMKVIWKAIEQRDRLSQHKVLFFIIQHVHLRISVYLKTVYAYVRKSSDEDARHIFHTTVSPNRDVSVPKDFPSFQLGWQAAPKRATEITETS